jgi:hypothetical protein
VFDELIRTNPSDAATFESELTIPTDDDGKALNDLFAELKPGVEDWSESIQMICARCSVSNVHEHPPGGDVTPIRLGRHYGFAGTADAIVAGLERWAAAGAGRRFEPIAEVG